jgi:hypothetical protein
VHDGTVQHAVHLLGQSRATACIQPAAFSVQHSKSVTFPMQ